MDAIGIIPARLASTRLKEKVLADLLGKPLIQHVWEHAKKSKALKDVIIACDDEKIKRVADAFGARALLTSKDHKSGSDRVIEAAKDIEAGIIVNIQGDEPLIHPSIIDDLVGALKEDDESQVATVIKRIETQAELDNQNIVKVVIDKNDCALYFSRSRIPYNRTERTLKELAYYRHLGIYAYKKDFLMNFNKLPESILEKTEKLEQLRILQAGYKIKTIKTTHATVGVDTKEDLAEAAAALKKEVQSG